MARLAKRAAIIENESKFRMQGEWPDMVSVLVAAAFAANLTCVVIALEYCQAPLFHLWRMPNTGIFGCYTTTPFVVGRPPTVIAIRIVRELANTLHDGHAIPPPHFELIGLICQFTHCARTAFPAPRLERIGALFPNCAAFST